MADEIASSAAPSAAVEPPIVNVICSADSEMWGPALFYVRSEQRTARVFGKLTRFPVVKFNSTVDRYKSFEIPTGELLKDPQKIFFTDVDNNMVYETFTNSDGSFVMRTIGLADYNSILASKKGAAPSLETIHKNEVDTRSRNRKVSTFYCRNR